MFLRRLGWCMGLTGERTIERSEVLYQPAEVIGKERRTESDIIWPGHALGNLGLDLALSSPDGFSVTFAGKSTQIPFYVGGRETFERFKVGDRVRLAYREVCEVTRDYEPPDFDEKSSVEKRHFKYEFVGAEKI